MRNGWVMERKMWMRIEWRGRKGQTWYAEEAVPNTNPVGKLPLLIFWATQISNPTTTTNNTRSFNVGEETTMPFLSNIVLRSRKGEREKEEWRELMNDYLSDGVFWRLCQPPIYHQQIYIMDQDLSMLNV